MSASQSLLIPRGKWALALVVGTVLYLAVAVGSQVIPISFLPGDLEGFDYAYVGIVQIVLGLAAIALALRIVKLRLGDVGLLRARVWPEAAIGAAIAILFAVLQFGFIIPATGGAERSDVVANAAQIGESWWGVAGFVVLAWTGAATEEVFFRGHFLNTLRGAVGDAQDTIASAASWRGAPTVIAAVSTIALFAALHTYQGWAGVIDTGLYGGLTLTLLYLWRRDLTACIVAHALWNTLATIGLFLIY